MAAEIKIHLQSYILRYIVINLPNDIWLSQIQKKKCIEYVHWYCAKLNVKRWLLPQQVNRRGGGEADL